MNLKALTITTFLALTLSSIYLYSMKEATTNMFKDQIGGYVKEKGCSMATFQLDDLQNQNFVVPCAGTLTGIVCSVDSQKKPSCTSAPILDEYSKPIPYSEDTQEIFSVGKIGEITYFGIRNKDQGI